MYSWGRGAEGQLGLGGLQDTPTPVKVKALQGKKALQVGQVGGHGAAWLVLRWWVRSPHTCRPSPQLRMPHVLPHCELKLLP